MLTQTLSMLGHLPPPWCRASLLWDFIWLKWLTICPTLSQKNHFNLELYKKSQPADNTLLLQIDNTVGRMAVLLLLTIDMQSKTENDSCTPHCIFAITPRHHAARGGAAA